MLVVMVVALFLEKMSLPELVAATHSALTPLKHLGVDPDRGVVRLMLALRYAESLPRPRDWRMLLASHDGMQEERIEVPRATWGWPDWIAFALLAIAIAATWRLG